jgi:L-seryl-tRNA(Ser) seleniumtransferase
LREVPALRMLAAPQAELRRRAEALAEPLRAIPALSLVRVAGDEAYVGGGSLPDQAMPSWVVELAADGLSDAELAYRLRAGTPAVMARVRRGRVVLDVRTVLPHHEAALVEAVRRAVAPPDGSA